MYIVRTDKIVDKFLFSHVEIALRFFEKIEIMKTDPFDSRIDYKKLQNTENRYRLRIGKYRFLYEILKKEIVIYFYDADSRGDIYK